jgi:hypothetical protein
VFNFSIKLRRQSAFESPKGPGVAGAKKSRFFVNGTSIECLVPGGASRRHAGIFTARRELRIDNSSFEPLRIKNYDWLYFPLIHRDWDFCGDWFLGRMGVVNFGVNLLFPSKFSGKSLFHPKVFEAAISDYMWLEYGADMDESGKVQDWLVPSDWQVKKFADGNDYALFKAIRRAPLRVNSPVYHFFAPVAPDWMVAGFAQINRYNVYLANSGKAEPNLDNWVDAKPFEALSQMLMENIEVKLSPEAAGQRRESLVGVDQGLAKDFQPIKFV